MIELPILIGPSDDGTFRKAHSISRAECEMEPRDVGSGIWRAWDASGVPLKMLIAKRPTLFGLLSVEQVSIVKDQRFQTEDSTVRGELVAYLKEIGAVGDELEQHSFRDLLALTPALE